MLKHRERIKMKLTQANEIIDCLPQGKTHFRYFKDQYAFLLLADLVGQGMTVKQIKQTSYARLLKKREVQQSLAHLGQSTVRDQDLRSQWIRPAIPFLLSLTTWGGRDRAWAQTSRPGYNVVLQLNFSEQHNQAFERLAQPHETCGLNYGLHPVNHRGERSLFRHTLAWARMDVDFERDEALIEEIQSDWVRRALYAWQVLQCSDDSDVFRLMGSRRDILMYLNRFFAPYIEVWEEAMLMATVRFIRHELGLRHIYYHSFETGNVMKRLRGAQPPRRLYSQLPRQFCFEKVAQAPAFLMADSVARRGIKKSKTNTWYYLH